MTLHPDFPMVCGDYALTKDWTLTLPVEFNRRIEDGSMVLWMPELTFWINIWNNDGKVPAEAQLDRILKEASPDRSKEHIARSGTLLRLTYELAEEDSDQSTLECKSISGHVISASGYVQIAAYYDTPAAMALGYQIISSVRESCL